MNYSVMYPFVLIREVSPFLRLEKGDTFVPWVEWVGGWVDGLRVSDNKVHSYKRESMHSSWMLISITLQF